LREYLSSRKRRQLDLKKAHCQIFKHNEEEVYDKSMLLYRSKQQETAEKSKKIKNEVHKRIKKMADDQRDNNQKRALISKMEKTVSMIKRNNQNGMSCPSLTIKKIIGGDRRESMPNPVVANTSELRGKMNDFFKSKGLIDGTRIANEHHLQGIHQTYLGKDSNYYNKDVPFRFLKVKNRIISRPRELATRSEVHSEIIRPSMVKRRRSLEFLTRKVSRKSEL
jgi:hypothetical protein